MELVEELAVELVEDDYPGLVKEAIAGLIL